MSIDRAKECIDIYNAEGVKQGEIILPERIRPIPGKRGGLSETGLYYKGSGIVYGGHFGDSRSEQAEPKARVMGQSGIPYEDLLLCFDKLVGMHGIFLFPHQPIFSDFEGGCGRKEAYITENQKNFKRSAIEEICNILPTGIPGHAVYVIRWKNVRGGIDDTADLIEYILAEGWNSPWDKNLWEDVYAYGYVTDIADWFRSDKDEYRLGTVYALLNSLYRKDKTLYARLLQKLLGGYDFDKKRVLYYSAMTVKHFCPESFSDIDLTWDDRCFRRLFTILASGKACCHLEDEEKYAWVREYYIEKCGIGGKDKI